MIKKLTKNFNFLEKNSFHSNWKNEIIEYIDAAEKLNDIDYSINCISKALECVLNEFISQENIGEISKLNLHDKITIINEWGRINSRYFFAIMHEIRNLRNHKEHGHNDEFKFKPTMYDALIKLKNLHIIIVELFRLENIDDFDFDCYKSKFKENNISAISIEQRKDDNKIFNNAIIEDLKIEKDNIKSWLSIKNSKLVVPIYQRKYEWKKDNIDALFEDIKTRMIDGEEHYFGTIAQKKKIGYSNNDPNLIKIIDGQQRITTSLLLICAVRQIIIERKYCNSIKEIDWYNEIINNHYNNTLLSNYIYNPGGTIENNEMFRKILDNNENKIIDDLNLKSSNKFVENYKNIYKKINDNFKTKEEIFNFVNTFLYKFRVASISFDYNTFTNKREMEIFENLNTKGLELSLVDLIKNYLFNFCEDDLLNNKEDYIPYRYNQIIASSKIESNLEDFYVSLCEIIKGDEFPKQNREKFILIKNSLNKLLKKFDKISKIEVFDSMMSFIGKYMLIYSEIYNPSIFIKFIGCEKIIDIIHDSKKKKLFFYFLFIIYNQIQQKYKDKFDFNCDKQEIKLEKNEIKAIQNLFLEVVKYIIKTKVITTQGDSNIKRLLISIVANYFNIERYKNESIEKLCEDIKNDLLSKVSKSYTHEEFILKLKTNSSHKQIIDLLILTEAIMTNSLFDEGEWVARSSKTIEHILPQESKKWKSELTSQEEIDEFEEKEKTYREKIGNYLILNKKLNSKASNETFLYKKNSVYKNLISPLYSNENIDIDISKKTNWNFENIEKRTNSLIKFIIEKVITN